MMKGGNPTNLIRATRIQAPQAVVGNRPPSNARLGSKRFADENKLRHEPEAE